MKNILILTLFSLIASGCATTDRSEISTSFINKRFMDLENSKTATINKMEILERELFRVIGIMEVNTSIKIRTSETDTKKELAAMKKQIKDLREEMAEENARSKSKIIEDNPEEYKRYIELQNLFK